MLEALSEPARFSELLQLNVQEGIVTVIIPTSAPTAAPTPSITPDQETPTPESDTPGGAPAEQASPSIGLGELALAIPGVVVAAALGYALIAPAEPDRTRIGLMIVVGGLAGYNYVALGFPGSQVVIRSLGLYSGVVMAVVFASAASLIAYLGRRRSVE